MDDDGGVEQALRVGAPSARDARDARERVSREVVEDGVEYLVGKAASEVVRHDPGLYRQCNKRHRRGGITTIHFDLWYVRVGAEVVDRTVLATREEFAGQSGERSVGNSGKI